MNESATSVDGNEPGTEKADVDKLSPQALNFQSPLRAVSPVFGSPGHIQAALSQAASPINNSTFSANLRALIGEDETLGAPEKPSVTELADEIARLRGEFQAQTDALALKDSMDKINSNSKQTAELNAGVKTMSLKQKEQTTLLGRMEDTIAIIEGQVQAVAEKAVSIEAFTQLENRLQQSEQREQVLRSDIKKLTQLFEELSKSEQLQMNSTTEIMNDVREWRSEVNNKLSEVDEKIAFISSRQNSLRQETSRERHVGQRSSQSLSQSVHIVEEDIRDVKRQLTQAVSLFRKHNKKIAKEAQPEDGDDIGEMFRTSVVKDISTTLFGE
eukprot:g3014.t1